MSGGTSGGRPAGLARRLLLESLPEDDWARELVGELDREFAGLAEPRRTGWRGQLRWAARVASPDTLAFVWRTRRRKGEVGRMAGMLHDFRLAVRGLVREARTSAFIVMTLALGIGSVTAMYGVAERLFLSGPRHVRAPEELVRVLLSFENERIAGRTAPWVPWLTAARSPMARLPSRGSRSTGATSGWGASEASRARSR